MQNYCKTIGALAAASALVAGNASAEVEYELHTGYSSEYLFRGQNLGQNLVEAGADVATEWSGFGLSAGLWYGSFSPNGPAGVTVDEIDLYTEASKDWGFLTTSVGYIYYLNDFRGNGTLDNQEVYFGLSRDFGFLEASLTYYWAVAGAQNEGYSELALSRSFELSPCLALNCGTNVGFMAENGNFTAWTTKIALDWGFAERAKLSPFVALAIALGSDDTAGATNTWATTAPPLFGTQNELVGGCMLSCSF
jgi:hypothetical protein